MTEHKQLRLQHGHFKITQEAADQPRSLDEDSHFLCTAHTA